ncbi:DinB family protein [Mesonia aestuariivivens]|uniref:DinB family protein n=1 Tax=Mesonia aestuariivivens TaxID=2796128 RepID=A0ABS6W1K7_9FLAO|nr:DinB family protein [Mesonia aestuariivivens]MBW2961717.1 DinB family protein [Mesonia aestuariivivens]
MIRKQLIKHLEGGEAFTPLDEVVEEINIKQLGVRPEGLPYSFYELFYHIVFAQQDILNYILDENYLAPQWPDGYWSKVQTPKNKQAWEDLKQQFFKQRKELIAIVEDEDLDLNSLIKNSKEHTLFRQLMLIVEHNAYHTGQLLVVLRLLDLHS